MKNSKIFLTTLILFLGISSFTQSHPEATFFVSDDTFASDVEVEVQVVEGHHVEVHVTCPGIFGWCEFGEVEPEESE